MPPPLTLTLPVGCPPQPDGEQGGGQWRQENAVKCAEVAWDMHNHAPILGEIDRAIAEGVDSSHAFGEMVFVVLYVWYDVLSKHGVERAAAVWDVACGMLYMMCSKHGVERSFHCCVCVR